RAVGAQDGGRGAHGNGAPGLQGGLHRPRSVTFAPFHPQELPLAEIQPFRGVRYRVPADDLARVLCPPYDVISPSYQQELYDRDRRNIVRVVLTRNPGESGYDEAGATYRGWLAAGMLAPDAEPSLYLLAQDFEVEGRTYTRHGLLARFRAEDPDK